MSNAWSARNPRERKLIIAFAVVAALGGGMKVMASGGSAVAVDDGTPHAPVDATSMPPVVSEEPEVTDPEAEVEKHPTGPGSRRDPFTPRVSVTSATDGGASTGGGETTTGGKGDTGTDASLTVQLEDVYPDAKGNLVAVLKLDGTRFKAREGVTAADLVTVMQLTDRCGVFEQGEGSFALCVGQAIERTR